MPIPADPARRTRVSPPLVDTAGSPAQCPTQIQSPRVLLVPLTEQYVDSLFAEFTSEITRFMFPCPASCREETLKFVQTCAHHRERSTEFVFAITKAEDGEFLGVIGLHARGTPQEPEIGLWLKKSAHGNHYGREAVFAIKKWSEEALLVTHFIYPVDRNNIPSRKIPEILGGKIVHEGKVVAMGGTELDEVVYRIPASVH